MVTFYLDFYLLKPYIIYLCCLPREKNILIVFYPYIVHFVIFFIFVFRNHGVENQKNLNLKEPYTYADLQSKGTMYLIFITYLCVFVCIMLIDLVNDFHSSF